MLQGRKVVVQAQTSGLRLNYHFSPLNLQAGTGLPASVTLVRRCIQAVDDFGGEKL